MTELTAVIREAEAHKNASILLGDGDRAAKEAALDRLPVSVGDRDLLKMSLGLGSRGPLAMMLGKAALGFVEFGDAAAGIGISSALVRFWRSAGRDEPGTRPLSRVELGSALVMQVGGLVRLGNVDRGVALVDAFPGEHEKGRYLAIRAAEGLARAQREDEARALLPRERPEGDIAESTAWDVVTNLLADMEGSDTGPDYFAERDLGTIKERWNTVLDKIVVPLRQMALTAGPLAPVAGMLITRIDAERQNVPQDEAAFIERVNGLQVAMRTGIGVGFGA